MADLGVSLYRAFFNYKAYGAASLALFPPSASSQPSPQSTQESASASSKKTNIARQNSSNLAFMSNLEKHLDDYKKGKGYLSRETSKEVARQSQGAYQMFSEFDLSASNMFSGYLTGLSYEKRSRYINQAHETAENLSRISRLA